MQHELHHVNKINLFLYDIIIINSTSTALWSLFLLIIQIVLIVYWFS